MMAMNRSIVKAAVFLAFAAVCASVWAGGGRESAPRWEGMFTGVIPAADGPGISVVAIFNADHTYHITHQHIGKGIEVFQFNGTFEWNEQSKTITLDRRDIPFMYRLDKNGITQLDMEGNKITGALANNYRLRRVE